MRKATGFAVGAASAAVAAYVAGRRRSRRRRPPSGYHGASRRVLVLGGGFGGAGVATAVARQAPAGTAVLVVDRHDYLTFWPMVPEVIPGSIELQHALRPLAPELADAGVLFQRAEVEAVDLHQRVVRTSAGEFGYDDLVIALGWRTSFHGVDGAAEHCLSLDGIEDAMRIRDHVIGRLEEATAAALSGHAPNPADLAFVVVGGGATGVEVAANIRLLLDNLLPAYPELDAGSVSVHLLQAEAAILPHLDPQLERVAQARLASAKVRVRTDVHVRSVDEHGVTLSDGSLLRSTTVVWAAGVRANPIAGNVEGAKLDGRGRIEVDAQLRVDGRRNVWALGDIAAVTSGGHPVPATAQAAEQAAECVAANVVAAFAGGGGRNFEYRDLGQLVDLGSRFAVSQVFGRRVSGRVAHLLWRGVYLAKLGHGADRARVIADWALDAIVGPRVSRLPLA